MLRGRTAIAFRTLLALDKDDRQFEIKIAVGEPYEVSRKEWACPASMEGLHECLADTHGVDSWQAQHLAFQLVGQMLAYFVDSSLPIGSRLHRKSYSRGLPRTNSNESGLRQMGRGER